MQQILLTCSRLSLALGALFLLGGCDGNGAAGASHQDMALAASKTISSPALVVSDQSRHPVTVGSMGGSIRLTDNIGAVYSIALRDGGAWLAGVALLRGTSRGWYNNGADQVPLTLNNVGVGGSIGRHMIVVTPKADAVWADDVLNVPLGGDNVALFDGAGETLTFVSTASIEAYLGPAPIADARQRKALVQDRLGAMLKNSPAIKASWPTP